MNKLVLMLLITFSLGCSKGFKINSSIGSELSFFKESSSKSFIPESDRVTLSCHHAGEICVYLKNPVFQESKLISPTDLINLKSSQNFSAKLTGVDKSGFIKNQHFDILSTNGARLTLSAALETRGLDSDHVAVSYLNAYYWLNRAHEYLKTGFKSYPSLGHEIKVYVDDAFEGWSWRNRSLHLDSSKKSALSADVLLLLFGEAQVGFATEGEIYNPSPTLHNECSGDPVGCCKTSSGCSQALLRGSGDAFVSMLFEDALGVGEFHHQNISGQSVCGKARNPAEFKDVTFAQAFSMCTGKSGSALAMGMVYASIWHEVRKSYDSKKVDEVFLKHLYKLDGSDGYQTALTKIQATCSELGYSDLADLFATEFARR